MLSAVIFTEDKVLVFVILRRKSASLRLTLTLTVKLTVTLRCKGGKVKKEEEEEERIQQIECLRSSRNADTILKTTFAMLSS